ncbi:tetratricopeptide repeat protein 22-like [Patiria miniata]|uniref:Tetratricopeptide repeat protein n=1 Tax=Patiria miniata TaxID=46514 RepID=A0A913Z1Z4_PATMI|nr:tetratricopeptide repeat protein 22-like [Patiria miniata]
MSSADEFGLFRLPLTLNKGHVDLKVAERLFATKNRYLERFTESRPEHYANWNLLGMLAFRLGQFEEALQYLDKVLSSGNDPDNLNALANRKYICEKLYLFTEARDCEQKIARLLGQPDTKEGKRRLRMLRARSISEQAFAFTNEIFEESVTNKKDRKSFDLYQAAIELAGEDVAQSEREDWFFESGLACKRIYGQIKWDKSKKDEVKQFYQDAVNNFITIVQISDDEDRKSGAWRHLGDLFHQPRDLLPSIPETYRDFLDQPNKCFEKALSLSPNDPKVLNSQAKHFKGKRNQSKALSFLQKSIDLVDSEFNLSAHRSRAKIYLSQYKQQLKDYEKSRVPSEKRPDETLLTRAKEDLSLTIKDVSKPWYKESMAEVLYYTASLANGRLYPGRKDVMQQALMYCAQAVETADGSKRSKVHELRGKVSVPWESIRRP